MPKALGKPFAGKWLRNAEQFSTLWLASHDPDPAMAPNHRSTVSPHLPLHPRKFTDSSDPLCNPFTGKGPEDAELVSILWLAQHDPDPATAEAALDLWDDCGCAVPPGFVSHLLKFLCSQHADVRVAAAEALAFGLQV